jgi:cyclopropane fatty-acyl-phospholipid synthase-like methyltransferase
MTEEVLALLDLKSSERVLDIGCGNGSRLQEARGADRHTCSGDM